MTGIAAAAMHPIGLGSRRLRIGRSRTVLLLVGRSVIVPSAAAVHEEHGQRAGKEEEQEDESRCAQDTPPFVVGPSSLARGGEGHVNLVCRWHEFKVGTITARSAA